VPKAYVCSILRSITHWNKRSVNEEKHTLVVMQKDATMKLYKLSEIKRAGRKKAVVAKIF